MTQDGAKKFEVYYRKDKQYRRWAWGCRLLKAAEWLNYAVMAALVVWAVVAEAYNVRYNISLLVFTAVMFAFIGWWYLVRFGIATANLEMYCRHSDLSKSFNRQQFVSKSVGKNRESEK